MKIILGLILFCVHFPLMSQTPYFEYQNLANQAQIATCSFQDSNDEYIIATDYNQDCKIIKLDNQGNLIQSKIFQRDGFESHIWHMFERENSYVALGIQSFLTIDSTLLWVLEMDSDFNVLDEQHHFIAYHQTGIPFQCSNQYIDTLICVGTGSIGGFVPTDAYGFKYLSNDEILISEMDWGANEIINDIVVSPNNPNRYFINGFNLQITDASFNLLESINNPFYTQLGDLHPLTDTTFLIAGKDLWFDTKEIRMGVLNLSGTETNSVLIGTIDSVSYTTFSKSIDTVEEYIYLGGTTRVIDEFPIAMQEANSNFILGKYDYNLQEQWLKLYGGDGYYFMTHMHTTNDGGALMIGSKYDFENNPGVLQLYVLKVDGNGDIVNTTTIPLETTKLTVYPNPAFDELIIELSSTQYAQADKEVVLYDLLGRKLLEKEMDGAKVTLDLSSLASATYFLVVKNEDGEVIAKEEVVKVD